MKPRKPLAQTAAESGGDSSPADQRAIFPQRSLSAPRRTQTAAQPPRPNSHPHANGKHSTLDGSIMRTAGAPDINADDAPRKVHPLLTKTEVRVARLISLGCTVREVAALFHRSDHTVDNHKASAMKKLGTRNLAQFTRRMIADGISPLNDQLTDKEDERLQAWRAEQDSAASTPKAKPKSSKRSQKRKRDVGKPR